MDAIKINRTINLNHHVCQYAGKTMMVISVGTGFHIPSLFDAFTFKTYVLGSRLAYTATRLVASVYIQLRSKPSSMWAYLLSLGLEQCNAANSIEKVLSQWVRLISFVMYIGLSRIIRPLYFLFRRTGVSCICSSVNTTFGRNGFSFKLSGKNELKPLLVPKNSSPVFSFTKYASSEKSLLSKPSSLLKLRTSKVLGLILVNPFLWLTQIFPLLSFTNPTVSSSGIPFFLLKQVKVLFTGSKRVRPLLVPAHNIPWLSSINV